MLDPSRAVRVAFDYQMSWPISLGHVLDRPFEHELSDSLTAEIRALVEVWHTEIAIGSPLADAEPSPEALERFRSRVDAMKCALALELGDAFEVL